MPIKLILFGIDGACNKILTCLMAAGQLCAFERLKNSGIAGRLQSTFPPHTAPAWSSMFTGVNPGEHGIYQFWKTKSANYRPPLVTSHEYGREPLWRMLERAGMRVGVVNVPMTHPPVKLRDGYMISWPLSPTIHYSEPPELTGELARAGLHFQSDIVTMYRGQNDYINLAHEYIKSRTSTLLYLQSTRPVDALITVYTELDRISHHYWGDGKDPAPEVLDAYMAMDEALGRILQLADEDTVVVVVSDHGFGHCSANLNVHYLLESVGLMARYASPDGNGRHPPDIVGSDLASWFDGDETGRKVDWSRTQAYMPTPGCFGININRRGREEQGIVGEDEVPGVVTKIRAAFDGLRMPDGKSAFSIVPSNEVYRGTRADEAPDLILLPGDWSLMPHPGFGTDLLGPPTQQGIHRMDGIFLATGPGIRPGMDMDADIEDVTPFVLARLGLPIPSPLDGHWLLPPPTPIRREPAIAVGQRSSVLAAEEEKLLEQRLADLGYL